MILQKVYQIIMKSTKRKNLLNKILEKPIAETFNVCYLVYYNECIKNNIKTMTEEEFINKASEYLKGVKQNMQIFITILLYAIIGLVLLASITNIVKTIKKRKQDKNKKNQEQDQE